MKQHLTRFFWYLLNDKIKYKQAQKWKYEDSTINESAALIQNNKSFNMWNWNYRCLHYSPLYHQTKILKDKMNGNSYFESEGINMAILFTAGTLFGILFYWLAFVVHYRLEKWNWCRYGDSSHRLSYDEMTTWQTMW